ncbi:MAG: hypothetical protein FJ294_03195 [Planctomycetes bacterium]|nr:hypothetical protein [Planctomycetota bacterium]
MKLKFLLGAVALVAALFAAHRYLNGEPSFRGAFEVTTPTASTTPGAAATPVEKRERFRVGFLPVT